MLYGNYFYWGSWSNTFLYLPMEDSLTDFFIWCIAFFMCEHRQKTAEQKGLIITSPQSEGLKRQVYTLNYFGPVW
jgi:hypothetical protein